MLARLEGEVKAARSRFQDVSVYISMKSSLKRRTAIVLNKADRLTAAESAELKHRSRAFSRQAGHAAFGRTGDGVEDGSTTSCMDDRRSPQGMDVRSTTPTPPVKRRLGWLNAGLFCSSIARKSARVRPGFLNRHVTSYRADRRDRPFKAHYPPWRTSSDGKCDQHIRAGVASWPIERNRRQFDDAIERPACISPRDELRTIRGACLAGVGGHKFGIERADSGAAKSKPGRPVPTHQVYVAGRVSGDPRRRRTYVDDPAAVRTLSRTVQAWPREVVILRSHR